MDGSGGDMVQAEQKVERREEKEQTQIEPEQWKSGEETVQRRRDC